MIFQKRPKKSVDINFNIGTEPIVQEYTYLGTRLTPTGNFTLAVEHLKEKALYAFASIRKQTLLNRLNPNTASQIFDTTTVRYGGCTLSRILKHGIVPQ